MTKEEVYEGSRYNLVLMGKALTPADFYFKSPDFHYELSDIMLNKSLKQVMIQAPRSTAKSTLAILTILNNIAYDEGDKVIVVQSKTRKEALRRLRAIKEILEYNAVWGDLYGNISSKTATMWREDEIQFTFNGWKVDICALGTGMPMRGILEKGTRITLYLLDDPEDEDNTKTEDSLQFNFEKFLGNLFGLDVRNGRCIVIGTPICANCIVDRLDDSTDWVTKKYTAKGRFLDGIYEEDFDYLLWEERYSAEELKRLKEFHTEQGTLYKYYADICCTVQGSEEQIFKKEYLQYYDGELLFANNETILKITSRNHEEIEPEYIPVNTILGIDPASSIEKSADYPVIFPIAVDKNRNIYCLPYFRKRVTPTEFVDEIFNMYDKVHPVRGGIETTGYQEMLRDTVRLEMDKRGKYIPGFDRGDGFRPSEEKKKRLREGLHSHFYRRRVYLKDDMFDFKNELLGFPRGLRHDDLLDGFYYAIKRIVLPDHIYKTPERQQEDDLKYFLTRGGTPTAWAR